MVVTIAEPVGAAQEAEVIFKPIFGKSWEALPPVLRRHYAVRDDTADSVTVTGHLDIQVARLVGWLSRLTGLLVPYSGRDVPVTVRFSATPDGAGLVFDRRFHYPQRTVHFRSCMVPVGGSEVIEYMRFGIGWRLAYCWVGTKIILQHRGYVWRIFGCTLPMPFALFFGAGYAEEWAEDENSFRMLTHVRHPLFGTHFTYTGRFSITELACPDPS